MTLLEAQGCRHRSRARPPARLCPSPIKDHGSPVHPMSVVLHVHVHVQCDRARVRVVPLCEPSASPCPFRYHRHQNPLHAPWVHPSKGMPQGTLPSMLSHDHVTAHTCGSCRARAATGIGALAAATRALHAADRMQPRSMSRGPPPSRPSLRVRVRTRANSRAPTGCALHRRVLGERICAAGPSPSPRAPVHDRTHDRSNVLHLVRLVARARRRLVLPARE